MFTTNDVQLIAPKNNRQLASKIGFEARQLLDHGNQRGWEVAVLGQAPMPREHIHLGDWLIVPAEQDSSEIPARTMERIQSIFEAGIRPKGFVMVHEAPKMLAAPQDGTSTSQPISFALPDMTPALKAVGGVLGTLAVVTLGIGGLAVAIVAGAALAIPAVLLAGAVAIDPILIVVTGDDIWIEIDRWMVS